MALHKEKSAFYFEKMKFLFQIIKDETPNIDPLREHYSIPAYIGPEEPNEELYKVATYYLDRYKALTQVMWVVGAPLDTNYVERAIKAILRLRNNSLFFNNEFSAKYSGDILSLTETTNENKVNVFIYLEYLLDNAEKVLKKPHYYLPWLYDKEDSEKEAYWKKVNALIHSSASPPEPATVSRCRSSG